MLSYEVAGIGYAPDGHVARIGRRVELAQAPDLAALVEVLAHCNDAELAQEDGQWKVIGEPTEGALRLAVIPFDSQQKFMAAPDQSELTPADLDQGLEFLGLVGILDPPHPEAVAAIAAFHQAGIRVKMITGDHAGTAGAIGRESITDGDRAATGAQLEAASNEELRRIVQDYDVLARTTEAEPPAAFRPTRIGYRLSIRVN